MKKLILLILITGITMLNTGYASVSQEKHNKLVKDYNKLLNDTKEINRKHLDMVDKYNAMVEKNNFLSKNKNSNFNVAQCNAFLEISNQAYTELNQSDVLKNNSGYYRSIQSIKKRIANIINDFDSFAMRDLFTNLNRLGKIEEELNHDLAKAQIGLEYNSRLLECESHVKHFQQIKNNSTLFKTSISVIKSNKDKIRYIYSKISAGEKLSAD